MNSDSEIPDDDATALSFRQMKVMLEVSRLFASTSELDTLLHKIVQTSCSMLGCERTSIWIHDASTDELFTIVILDAKQLRVPPQSGVVSSAFHSSSVINVRTAYEDTRFNPSSDRTTGFCTRNLMAVRMVDYDGQPVGVIQAVNKIDGPFTARDESLIQLLSDQAGVAIQRNNLLQVSRDAAELKREIQFARQVQEALLPKSLPAFDGFDFFGWAKPASTTGGDCYDLWKMDDGRLGILLADASGHGLAPALIVSQLRTLVRSLCCCCPSLSTAHQVLARVNHRMSDDLEAGRFVTVFLGFLSPNGKLDWQSAGHGPVLLRSLAVDPIHCLQAVVPPINAVQDLPNDPPAPITLHPGSLLAILSDGIFESFNPSRQLFGIERVVESLESCKYQPAVVAVKKLLAAVEDWQKHDQPTDDQTIILLNRMMPTSN